MLESCKELGSPAPEYTVLGDDLTVKFTALASAVISNGHDDQKNDQKADQMGVSYKTVQRAINNLKEIGCIRRIGGKRFGHWEIIEKR